MLSLVILGLLALTIWVYYAIKPKKRTINLPGPRGLPFIGNALGLGQRMWLALDKWSQKYGSMFLVYLGPRETVIISDPKIAKEMLAMDAFAGRSTVAEFTLFEGENVGLLNSEAKVWEEQRRFIVRQLRDLGFGKSSMESVIMEEVNDFMGRIVAENGKPVGEIRNRLSLAVVNSLWSIVAGTRYSQDDKKLRNLPKQMSGAFDEAAKSGGLIIFFGWAKYVIPELSGYNSLRRMMNEIVEFVRKTVKEHKETAQPDSPRDLIDAYLNEMNSSTDPSSSFHGADAEKHLISSVGDLFQAGTETTSTTLDWAILHILKQPEIQRKLQKEIQSVTGNSRPVSFSDRSQMPYTLAVINELLRIAIVPFGVPHQVLFDTEYKGVFFPKGISIMINMHYIHHDPKLWGDPENFRPERFLTDDETALKKNEYLNPFLVGRRACPGETLARDTIFLFLTNLVQKFDILQDPNSPEPDLEPGVGFMIQAKPYKAVFRERQK